MTQADVARGSGLRPQLINEYLKGKKVPGADNAFSLADSVQVSARWLIRGEGSRGQAGGIDVPDEGWVKLPRRNLFKFTPEAAPEPEEMVPIPVEWLAMSVRAPTAQLWITEMPSDAMPNVAREGEPIICRDPDFPLQDGRVYVFLLDGRPIVRRVQIRPEGLVLKAEAEGLDAIVLKGEQIEQLVPIGRVLSAINLQAV
ncbi:MAG: phage repressor [Caulobacter sp.]|nr:phage repressor [Caulobacter sp.]